ncbi:MULTISPECIES: IclR family transcriptional regulator [Aneurinibacillus]|uniref:Glycerol operon regulatory protein n=1 Tax=Aneurinibacillus thermoaerophilus TaxID=143495 RepID=A0A1G8CQV4_ANETH|nr:MULTISPECIES: IclR family transcriptional regulator [Aneurinibacillus]AMA71847.1 IclR family transcriptional regulator [Aneurinibacillus sp. XH2]MED0680478.1 IclR family transcriptional regulator [Aneurinibacillus thermoaerophilus]MED0737262.1 IclR family transcriptional regulator [Aneurinibacillus thermoaerophilus]MED0757923.1 IclR family transcriptional regulator [Aneurinibacillus thermoaerophilus]MED0761621.1 IclR family transcriptional regulator [Aneurinibacillus thermoaerophilus]
MDASENKMTVRAADRALDILLCFIDEKELTLTEIARKVELNKSTVYRLLGSLENKGFLTRNLDTEKYQLGFRIWQLSANLPQEDDPAKILLPEMIRLRDQVGETISLYVRNENERIRVQAVESNETIRRVAPIGAHLPLSVGASSKVLVAYSSPEVQQKVLADPSWPSSIDKKAYMEQLEEIRKRGYATSYEEREKGAAAVAVPLFNRRGELVAALSVSGPSNRLTLERMMENLPYVMVAAKRMGSMLK